MQWNVISKSLVPGIISSLVLVLALSQTGFTSQQQKKSNLEVKTEPQLSQTAFTYQGQLIDASGSANGIYDLQFTLYTAQTGGEKLGVIVYEDLVLSNGLFTVQLDFGSAINSHENWLEVAVRLGNGTDAYTVLSPRQRLTLTPYAILAQAEPWSLIGVPIGFPDSVDIGAESPETVATDATISSDQGVKSRGSVKGDLTLPDESQAALAPQNTPNHIAKFDSFGRPLADSIMFDNGTNVGVGTTTPTQRLDVVGTVQATGFKMPTGASNGYVLTSDASGVGTWRPAGGIGGSGTPNFIPRFTGASMLANSNIYNNGSNVGIGTTSPAAELDVRGSDTVGLFLNRVSSPTFTLAALQVEQGLNTNPNLMGLGEAAWLRTVSNNQRSPVVKLVKHPQGANNFMEGEDFGGVRRFHISPNGSFVAGSDFAEALPAKGGKAGYEPGDVLVLSADQPRVVEKAHHPYDAKVAGIYSTRPAVLGAEKDGETRVDPDDIPVAIVGIVPTKVTAENGPIQPGDLLTTSSTPGHAMKASPVLVNGFAFYPTGTILGKALEPLEVGTGVIKVLVILR